MIPVDNETLTTRPRSSKLKYNDSSELSPVMPLIDGKATDVALVLLVSALPPPAMVDMIPSDRVTFLTLPQYSAIKTSPAVAST